MAPFEGEGLCEESVEVLGPCRVRTFSLPLLAGGEALVQERLGLFSAVTPATAQDGETLLTGGSSSAMEERVTLLLRFLFLLLR